MKTMVVLSVTEGGCDRKDYTQDDINKMKQEIKNDRFNNHNKNCSCNSCSVIRVFESMQIGEEFDGSKLNDYTSWIFMIKNPI